MRKKITLPSVFLTDEIEWDTLDRKHLERYEFTRNIADFLEYCTRLGIPPLKENQDRKDYLLEHKDLYEQWQDLFDSEVYQIPMMDGLWYFPAKIQFQEEDRDKVSANCTLIFDTELEQWAVGLTGAGMDFTPHLVDTFIRLDRGVPLPLVSRLSRNDEAYLNLKDHLRNCQIMGNACLRYSAMMHQYAIELLNNRKY